MRTPTCSFSSAVLQWAARALLVLGMTAPAHALQFNRDRTADLLQRDHSPGAYRLRVSTLDPLVPGAVAKSRAIRLGSGADGTRGYDVRTADFNGDGRSDILTRDLDSLALSVRLMDGVTVLATRTLTGLSGPRAGNLITTADFDGDGRSDMLFRHPPTGGWSIALMNGVEVRTAASGSTTVAPSAALRWVSSEDFDGDGRADVLLRDRKTLAWRMYLMNGRKVRAALAVAALPRDPDWQLQAVVDMNRDGQADLLFRHHAKGTWFAYFMDGARVLPSSGRASIYSSPNYDLEKIGDLNGDGYLDVLQRRAGTGRWYVNYLMDRWRLPESGFVAPETLPTWHVARIDDFTGDGVAEALVTDSAAGLLLVGLDDPRSPVVTPLGGTAGLGNDVACERPNYYQFGRPDKPPDAAANSAFLSWAIPVKRGNGEALCAHELAGYSLYTRASRSGAESWRRIDGARTDTWLLNDLAPDSYVFALYARDTGGARSTPAARASKTIR